MSSGIKVTAGCTETLGGDTNLDKRVKEDQGRGEAGRGSPPPSFSPCILEHWACLTLITLSGINLKPIWSKLWAGHGPQCGWTLQSSGCFSRGFAQAQLQAIYQNPLPDLINLPYDITLWISLNLPTSPHFYHHIGDCIIPEATPTGTFLAFSNLFFMLQQKRAFLKHTSLNTSCPLLKILQCHPCFVLIF